MGQLCCTCFHRTTLSSGKLDEERSQCLKDLVKYVAMFYIVTGESLNDVLSLSMSDMKSFVSVEYRKMVEKLYGPLRYGLEKRTIDRFGGQLWEVGSDGLRRPSSFVKRKVARE